MTRDGECDDEILNVKDKKIPLKKKNNKKARVVFSGVRASVSSLCRVTLLSVD